MPLYRIGGAWVHLNLGGKARKNPPPLCRARVPTWSDGGIARHICCGMGIALCDFPKQNGELCSLPICVEHSQQIGPDEHRCPDHKRDEPKAA